MMDENGQNIKEANEKLNVLKRIMNDKIQEMKS